MVRKSRDLVAVNNAPGTEQFFPLFLVILAFFVLLIAIIFLPDVSQLAQGIIHLLFGGESFARTALVLAFFIVNAVITVFVIKFELFGNSETMNKILAVIFCALLGVGFVTGFAQFVTYSQLFGSNGPFVGYVDESGFSGVEFSGINENRFPMASLYEGFKIINLKTPDAFDTGYPLYFPAGGAINWFLIYAVLGLCLIVSGLLLANTTIRRTGFLSYILLLFSEIGFLILVFDGGAFSPYIFVPMLTFLLFLEINYFQFENRALAGIFPLLGTSLYAFIVSYFAYGEIISRAAWPAVIFISALIMVIYIAKIVMDGELKMAVLTILLALALFGISVLPLMESLQDKTLGNYSQGETSVYVYGIPDTYNLESAKNVIGQFGVVNSESSLGWNAYFEINSPGVRQFEVQKAFIESAKPKGKLVANIAPLKKTNLIAKVALIDKTAEAWGAVKSKISTSEGKKVLDVKINSFSFDENEMAAYVSIEGNTEEKLQMLTILSWLRQNGNNARMIVAKVN